MSETYAREMLEEIDAARRETIRNQPKVWSALLAFALITAVAAPMYVTGPWNEFTPMFGGTVNVVHPALIQTYWLVALPAAYAGYALYMAWVADRTGVRENIVGPLAAGLVVYVLVVVATVLFPESLASAFDGGLTMRGLLPLFAPALALLFWGALWRNTLLIASSLVVVGAAAVSNLYNVENLVKPRGWHISSEHQLVANTAFTAIALFMCAAVVGAVEFSRGRK